MPLPLRVVNVDSAFRKTTGYQWLEERIRAAGGELILCRADTEDQLIAASAQADIVVVEHPHTPINARIIAAMTHTRAIVKCAVGLDNIDVDAATAHGIVVCNIADYCTEEVSDHTVGLLLAAVRRIPAMDRYIRAGGWDEPEPIPVVRRFRNLTLGIIGLGRIGSAVARKVRGFEMRILATDPYLEKSSEVGVQLVPLQQLLRESDLITLHVPLTVETRNLIGNATLACVKPSAILVNTSRGPVIDEEALIAALRENRLAAAALDVTVQEPLPQSSPLRALPNVILTPHFASHSDDARVHWQSTVANSLEALVRGYWPPFPADPGISPRVALQPWAAFLAQPSIAFH